MKTFEINERKLGYKVTVRFFNFVLTPDEILRLYNEGKENLKKKKEKK